jgi:hypothetical protein
MSAAAVDPSDIAGDSVRVMATVKRVLSKPQILEGEVSGTGKTIKVPEDGAHGGVRLDTEAILTGEREFRDSSCYQLYTPERFQDLQRSNKNPGPCAGTDGVTDAGELPDATHRPTQK